jgi:L-threonylcarbamoyladenylate synthase
VIVTGSNSAVKEATRLLKQGGLIAFPTETYYGLGVDPFNEQALQRLFKVKERSPDKAVLVLLPDISQVTLLASSIPAEFIPLMKKYWPGPLTLVFPGRSSLSTLLTGGTGTVGLRQTQEPLAAELLTRYGGPVTATSANKSGMVPATTAAEVKAIFGTEVDLILDGGITPGDRGSTLVGYKHELICLRQGCIPFTQIVHKPAR